MAKTRLVVRTLPHVVAQPDFGLKGGTAINFFYRDLPRVSVDVDLTYLPVAPRDESLEKIDEALNRMIASVRRDDRSIKARRAPGGGFAKTRFIVAEGETEIVVETSPVARGAVHPAGKMASSEGAQVHFDSVETTVLSLEDVYAGKLAAALDRQHPRDLYDVKVLYDHEGITEDIFRTFLVYGASSRRPLHELLAPRGPRMLGSRGVGALREEVYVHDVKRMAFLPVSWEELLEAQHQLHTDVQSRLSGDVATFLLSFHDAEPDFDLIGLPHAAELPAITWKLVNLKKFKRANPRRHAALRDELEKLLR